MPSRIFLGHEIYDVPVFADQVVGRDPRKTGVEPVGAGLPRALGNVQDYGYRFVAFPAFPKIGRA